MMKLVALLLLIAPCAGAQAKLPSASAALRSTLLSELRSTHNVAEWFVPVNAAVAGLTAEQAKWVLTNAKGHMDAGANHSVGMLAYHLCFWNARVLAQMKGIKQPAAPGNNDETFNDFNAASWGKVTRDLDQNLKDMETFVEHADDATLAKVASTVAHVCTHNAYHTGQILYVRKLQGTWNPANGVK